MTKRKTTGAAGEEPRGIAANWDFRLDRAGLMVEAGRYLQLRVSLGLLIAIICLVGGWGTFHMHWLTL
ncbi:hypothetical protein [Streptomyces sp. LN325]|uniref:hypothetical protein n=1 Tax=Streptomyces sp. LN325 TaxID=3112976 RepID=UPI003723E724